MCPKITIFIPIEIERNRQSISTAEPEQQEWAIKIKAKYIAEHLIRRGRSPTKDASERVRRPGGEPLSNCCGRAPVRCPNNNNQHRNN